MLERVRADRVDFCDLIEISPESKLRGIVPPPGWTVSWWDGSACPVLSFPAIPSGIRRKLRMNRHRAERAGGWARERTVVIGDTPRDIACARADGVRVAAVATGPFAIEALADRERALEIVPGCRDRGDERRGGLVPELGLGEAELLIGVTDGVVCLHEDPVRELVEGLGRYREEIRVGVSGRGGCGRASGAGLLVATVCQSAALGLYRSAANVHSPRFRSSQTFVRSDTAPRSTSSAKASLEIFTKGTSSLKAAANASSAELFRENISR